MEYEVLVTAVSERADLFQQTMESMLANLDAQPSRLIVHEDVRPGSQSGAIAAWLHAAKATGRIADFAHEVKSQARGLGPAMLWAFRQARTPIVFYTQEDWLFLRQVPVSRCLAIMEASGVHHVRFNKRKTMRAKHEDTDHPWYKVEVEFPVPDTNTGLASARLPEVQKFCIADHWYTQASLWRVAEVLRGLEGCQGKPQANQFVADFNGWMNRERGLTEKTWSDQQLRHQKMRTYIWGPVGEPAFIKHLGSVRTTGPIVHVGGA